MGGLHGISVGAAILLLTLMALAAGVIAALDRRSRVLEWARRIALVLLVAEAAVGLALLVRGGAPDQSIHLLYGLVIVLVLMIPGSVAAELSPRGQSGALALASAVAAALAWRLWGSG